MTSIKRSILPALAGAAVIVGGLDLTAYAGDRHTDHTMASATTTSTTQRAASAGHAFKYVIPKHTTVPFDLRLKGLPVGNYLASFDIAMSTSVTEPPFCNIEDSSTPFAVRSFGTVSDGVAHNSASGLVHVTRVGDARVVCDAGDTTINLFHSQNYVVLTPATKVTRGDVAAVARGRSRN
jgi:hypothetical protein